MFDRPILEKRASVGVEPGVIGGGELEYIARCSDSDAWDAIALFSHSVRNTANGLANRVTWAVIDDSKPDADQAVVRSQLSDLSRDQRLVLEVMADSIQRQAVECMKRIVSARTTQYHDRTLRGWLPKLKRYELIVKSGSEYEPVYEVREIALKEPELGYRRGLGAVCWPIVSIVCYSDRSSPPYWSSHLRRALISRRPRAVSV